MNLSEITNKWNGDSTALAKSKILIIDDELSNVALLEDILSEAGYTRIKSITDARIALETCRTFAPDLILLDLLMPHLDGFAILKSLRSADDKTFLPIMVLTADVSEETKRRALRAGASDFLFKPFDHLEVAIRIANLLEIRTALAEREAARHEAEEQRIEAQRQREYLAVTLASIGDCVIVADADGRITFMNRMAEQVTGWDQASAHMRQTSEVFKIVNEHTREAVESPVDKVVRSGEIVGLAKHTLLIRKDGTELPIDDSGAPIRDENGNLRGVVLVFRDFSEQARSERELREAAESANRAKDKFLAMLSHELRTPLAPVLTTLNLWEASDDVPAAMKPDVYMLRRNVELEARIIDDLLDLTRIARGRLSFTPENTDVHELIRFLISISQAEIHDKRLELSMQLDAPRHHVYTDASRLQQVLWNILRNAIKFTDPRGSIVISTMNDANNQMSIKIADTGVGMTPGTIGKVFVPFEQGDGARSDPYGGLGLGMAISHMLIELLHGQLVAESKGLGEGSAFTVIFPVGEVATRPEPCDVTPRYDSAERPLNILLVEDHHDTSRALVRLLRTRGYQVETAETVASGIQKVEQSAFDLLVCDIGLPDGTGFDLIEQVRKTCDTPALALSGFGTMEDVSRSREAGFEAHLTKPVNFQKLEATIWQLTSSR